MKKGLVILIAVSGVLIGGVALAHYWGGGFGGWGHMMGPGYGRHMTGYGYGDHCWDDETRYYEGTRTVTEGDVQGILRDYIGPNPNLKIGKIDDKGTHFEAEVLTKEDSLVARYGIDKSTGFVRPIY